MKCVDCKHMTSSANKDMARQGFSQCDKDPAGHTYLSPRRDRKCNLSAPAAPEDIEKRIAFLEKRNG
ncbi:hypothetical protein [Herbaspirillum sp. YR522]|uniref:hypothetical protein n=1 Tax=Herbaspirillum sp. YR522 TaxID=1144342 RepID=UPI00026FB35E|nr:hypothetical protein [Herbaspirillum sp. YR522]EJN07811.1 hypothetical protein PMI40_01707 [Herbaspirillum sp. YR522]